MAHVAYQTLVSVLLSNWSSILPRLKGFYKIQVCRKLILIIPGIHDFESLSANYSVKR